MPLSFETYIQKSCFNDFEEMLPEGVDKEILIEKSGNATEFFLLAHNNYANNDLIFSDCKLIFEQKMIKPISYSTHKDRILGENDFPNILDIKVLLDDKSLFPHRYFNTKDIKDIRTISLSGYQHKIQVVLENGTIRLPKNSENVNYFIKPYHPSKADYKSNYYFPHIAINEHLHLSFAKNELGFDVPESGLFKRKEDAEYHYIIKYFDRYKGYKFQRKEFSTYMGLNSDTKYQSSSEKLFATAAKVLLNEIDRLRMLEYYFYSFVIKHEDMHTKNISTIYDNGKLFIAPLYDIATTAFYDGINNYESYLSINGKQNNIRVKDFLVLVKKANISKDNFLQQARFILKTYKEMMPKYIKKVEQIEDCDFYSKNRANLEGKKVKIHPKISLGKRMQHSFEDRVKSLEQNGWFEQLKI
jgi:serine/threonine-protein kinase HipA